ncbi:hypothetical protein Droror1_Dr00024659 [Drosera rotundifolia]
MWNQLSAGGKGITDLKTGLQTMFGDSPKRQLHQVGRGYMKMHLPLGALIIELLDMSSLKASMPDTQLLSSFINGINESWFPPNTPNSFLGVASQSGFSYMSAQATSANLLPSMAKFTDGFLQCNQSFEHECVGPSKATYQLRTMKMLGK